ncbi:ATPase, T2SS/T4P/T4SS family [Azonexus sp.]|uniref:GspE/PulE family protein n=1 Tax=Azonexus sp. TaxID=1872668 RepID=UPI0039E29BC2
MNIQTDSNSENRMNDVVRRLTFLKDLHALTHRIHATHNVDEIMLGLSSSICELFACERLTLYVLGDDGNSIVAKVKTGLDSFANLKLPINTQSIAGYVASERRLVNIADVYDASALLRIDPDLRFLHAVDQRTGFRTREVLAAPIIDAAGGTLQGVIQLINNRGGHPFSATVEEGLLELCTTLAIAFAQRCKPPLPIRYGALVTQGKLSAENLAEAQRAARDSAGSLENLLRTQYGIGNAQLGAALAEHFHAPYSAFAAVQPKPQNLLQNLKRDYLQQNQWLPLDESDAGITLVSLDPEQARSNRLIDQLFPGRRLIHHVTTEHDFAQMLDAFFGKADAADLPGGTVNDLLSALDEESSEEHGESAAQTVSAAADNELVKLVNKIIVDAHQQGASDIHIEPAPGKGKVLVRLRKDGSLKKYIEIPASYRSAIVARIKIMCDLDIAEKRRPQDGKIQFKKFGPLDIELRVATLPSAGGVEDVVMRILAAGEPIALDKLGVLPGNLARLKSAVEKPYGLFFVCGPTGSGKTTTLHSVLGYLNRPETKIWTAEDPVEITQKGLRQVQVNKKAGLDFATVMRAFLRADPDIIMVGEMRDAETTAIGIEASLTGHLVFATLHTNSAPESIIRLLDMGMDPFNFSDALLGILAQRLAKRLCSQCKQSYTPDAAEMAEFMAEYCSELQHTPAFLADRKTAENAVYQRLLTDYGSHGKFVLQRPQGCPACDGSGYKGRVGLHELMLGSDALKKRIQEHARVAELLAQALADGMLTLKMDGMEKVLQGITDLKQVRTVCIK